MGVQRWGMGDTGRWVMGDERSEMRNERSEIRDELVLGAAAASDHPARKGPVRYTGIVIALDSKHFGVSSSEQARDNQEEISAILASALNCEVRRQLGRCLGMV
eukprot:746335-Hanusia_phi.AAC.5